MSNRKIEVECKSCGNSRIVDKYYIKKNPDAVCRSCLKDKLKNIAKSNEYRENVSKAILR